MLALFAESDTHLSFSCEFIELHRNDVRINDLFEGDMHYDCIELEVLDPAAGIPKKIKVILQGGNKTIWRNHVSKGDHCKFRVKAGNIGSFFPDTLWEVDLLDFKWIKNLDANKASEVISTSSAGSDSSS